MFKQTLVENPSQQAYATVWRASEAGEPCDTYLYNVRAGVVGEPFEPRVKRLLEDGNLHERDIVTRLHNSGYEVVNSCLDKQMEVIASHSPFIVGHPDGLLVNLPNDMPPPDYQDADFKVGEPSYMLEITAPNHFQFVRLQKEHSRVVLPKVCTNPAILTFEVC